jgi:CubicO group peptidase (beta-lactamase class C family)
MESRNVSGSNATWRCPRRDLLKSALAAAALPIVSRLHATPALAESGTPMAERDLDALFAELDELVQTRMAELKVPGVALGVIAGGREHTMTAGVTNVEHPLPVDADTLFQIGSTTKTYTATAIMHLVEQGTLDLEATVQTYLPDFRVADPDLSAAVRLRHLATHSSGWYDNLPAETGDGDDALARVIERMAELPRVAPLGKYFSYSNMGVSLLGRIIETVTGQTYEAAIAELILEPLGLERASFFAEEIITEGFAVGHGLPPDDPDGEPVVLEPWALPRSMNPPGGLIASLHEQLRYAHFHLGDGTVDGAPVLSAESLEFMQTPLGPGGTTPLHLIDRMGVIWDLADRDGARIVSHPGGTNGQQSGFTLVPEHGFAVTILTNATAGAPLWIEATDWALERFLGLRQPPVTTIQVDPARLVEYAGEYAVPDGSESVRIQEAGGALQLEYVVGGQAALAVGGETTVKAPLRFIGEDLVVGEALGLTVLSDFVRDESGKIAWLRFIGRLVPRVS